MLFIQVHKERANDEKAAFPHLAAKTSVHLSPGELLYLVPQGWMRGWREFVAGSGKRGAGPCLPPPEPGSLASAMLEVICDCDTKTHGDVMLKIRPPPVSFK